jgi:PAS domain S-box-containing protein
MQHTATSATPAGGANIFIVEDEGIIAHNIQGDLRKAGYRVAGVADSGNDALEQISGSRPDLILMDIRIRGDMDGIELARRVQEQFDIPVVYLTAHSDTETLQRAKVTGPFGYLAKPVQQSSLSSSIEIGLYKHRVESELRRQRAWLETILSHMADGVIVTDHLGQIRFLNAAAEKLTGWTAAQAAGQQAGHVLPLVEPELDLALDEFLPEAIAEGITATLPTGASALNPAGDAYPVDGELAPSLDGGKVVGTVITFRNAMPRRKEEQERRHQQKMLAVGRLAAGVAHDFNNLLTVILGYTDQAIRVLSPRHPVARDLEEVRKAGEIAATITKQLLTFSRKQDVEPETTSLNAIVRNHDALCRQLVGPSIGVSMTLGAALGGIFADPGQVAQILMNLVTNARDAMPEGGLLRIQTANVDLEKTGSPGSTNEYVALIVEDTGVGMDSKTADRLFEPFFTTKFPGRGTGLGLSIVDSIVRDLGGTIDVESAPGCGTTFTVYLPRVDGGRDFPALAGRPDASLPQAVAQ